MRHLILSFLVFSVNSFSQSLHGRFLDDSELAYKSVNPESSIFTDPNPADGSSDLFATADGSSPIDTANLGESLPLGTLDSLGTSLSPPNAAYEIATWPDHPEYSDSYSCENSKGLACCFEGMNACIWYNSKDAHCYYPQDLRCCTDIDENEIGIECEPTIPNSQVEILPSFQAVEDFLRIEVPTGWLAPLLGGSAYENP